MKVEDINCVVENVFIFVERLKGDDMMFEKLEREDD